MKFEPWVPSFMRRIAEIWREDSARERQELGVKPIANPKAVYVYGIQTAAGIVEVRSPVRLDPSESSAKLLRIEDE